MDGITPFLHRAEDYSASRPSYPVNLVALLRERCGLELGARVADVGSGTGIFTGQLLKAGATVFAVEPNDAMRAEAEAAHGSDPGFISVNATAEDLPFDDASLDLITCAQSFHWFNVPVVKAEFSRVLHGAGWLACFWNQLARGKNDATDILADALGRASEAANFTGRASSSTTDWRAIFAKGTYLTKSFNHHQELDADQAISLARSRSYWPDPASEFGLELEAELKAKLSPLTRGGRLIIQYTTDLHAGQLD